MRWKEPAGESLANSRDVLPTFSATVEGASGRFRSKKPRCKQPSPWDGEGGPRERWMRRVNPLDEIQAVFIAKAAPGVRFCLR